MRDEIVAVLNHVTESVRSLHGVVLSCEAVLRLPTPCYNL